MKKLNKLKNLAILATLLLVIISSFNMYMIHFGHFERFESMNYRWLEAGIYMVSASLWLYIFLKQEVTMAYVGLVLFSFLIGFLFISTIAHVEVCPIKILHIAALILHVAQIIFVASDIKQKVKNKQQRIYQ